MTKAQGPVARANRKAKREARAAVTRAMMEDLKREGARCESCLYRRRAPVGLSKNNYCELGSDFHGYQLISLDHLCTSYIKGHLP